MKKNIELSNEQVNEYLQELYECFENGYQFEEFLKTYLEKIGLDEISITQRSRDGGIDLTAVRPGVGNFSDADTVHYYIQAKRNDPSSTISVTKVRELKGTIPFSQKGIFITTAKFSKDAITESNNDPSKSVVLIDGKKLIESCIDNELGFIFVPVFKKELIKDLLINNVDVNETISSNVSISVDKMITANDIRARIIRVPNEILKIVEETSSSINLKLGDFNFKDYKFNRNGKFISGVTDFFNKYNFVDDVGTYYPKKVIWIKDEEGIKVIVDDK